MRKHILGIILGSLALGCLAQPSALAEVLITEAEAKLPNSPDVGLEKRGLTRGPGIEQVSPNADRPANSPLPFKVNFLIRNNVAIDPASVRLVYLKAKPVDLTDRIRTHLTPTGIEMALAEVPPGTHALRLDLKDKQGRTGFAILKLTIAAKP